MVNSGLCWRPRSAPRYTRQIWKMSPLPAASSRFIAYSGEVCRNSGRIAAGHLDAHAAEVHVRHRRIHHGRRFHFEHVARAEELARGAQRLRAPPQRREAGGGPPVPGSVTRRIRCQVPGAQRADAFAHAQRRGRRSSVACQSAAPGGNSRITVEPMLKRAISAPLRQRGRREQVGHRQCA